MTLVRRQLRLWVLMLIVAAVSFTLGAHRIKKSREYYKAKYLEFHHEEIEWRKILADSKSFQREIKEGIDESNNLYDIESANNGVAYIKYLAIQDVKINDLIVHYNKLSIKYKYAYEHPWAYVRPDPPDPVIPVATFGD